MRKTAMLSSRSSATVVWKATGMPTSASRRLSHCELVSRFWPLVSSLPMETISAFMEVPGPALDKPAGRLELRFAAAAPLLQELGHRPVGDRRLVAQRAERFQPGRHRRVRRLQAIEKGRPEGRPHAVVEVNDPCGPQLLLAVPLVVD